MVTRHHLWTRRLYLMVLAVLLSACEAVPHAPVDEAHSLGKGGLRVEGNYNLGYDVSAALGITDNVDIGMQLDSSAYVIASGWGRYSLVNKPEGGLSLAALGGVFAGTGTLGFQGVFAGPIASYRVSNALLSIRARYSKINFSHSDEDSYVGSDKLHDDILQYDASARLYFRDDRVAIKAGYGCVVGLGSTGDRDEDRDSRGCMPTVGLTFYR